MKILITGGAGFIGSNFVHYWLEKHPQDEVVNIDGLKYSGNLDNLEDLKNNPRHQFIKADICDYAEIDKIVEDGVDVIVHFAAQSHVDRSIENAYEFINSNIVGTKNLLEAAKKYQIKRFHQISTDEVFGDLELDSKDKFRPDSPLRPRNEYAATKAGAEHLVMAYFHTYGLPVTISNCTNNIGPYQYPEKFLPLAITNILENKKVPLYGTGLYVRDWLYVTDHCTGIDIILEKGKVGESYLIGSDHDEITNLDLLKKLLKNMGKGEELIEHVKDRPGHDRKYAVDSSKIKELGWRPEYDLDRAIDATVKWYVENEEWWKKIKSGKFREDYERLYKNK